LGLADIARHVIQRILNPRFLLVSQMASYDDVASNVCQALSRHVIDTHLNPGFVSQMASYDVASNIC